MKKKSIIILILVAVLALGAGFGTLAYYTQEFNSNGNTIVTAKFDPSDEGTILNEIFNISGSTFKPDSAISKQYNINLSNVEVAVKYLINVENAGLLFGLNGVTPINVNLVIKDFDKDNNQIVLTEFNQNAVNNLVEEYIPATGTVRSEFYLSYIWPESTEGIVDKNYAAQSGSVNFNVEVRQLTGNGDVNQYKDGKAFVVEGGSTYFNVNNNSGILFGNDANNKVTDVKLALYNINNELLGMLSLTEEGKIVTNANTTGIISTSVDCLYDATTGFANNDPMYWFVTDKTAGKADKNVAKMAWLFTVEGKDAGLYIYTK